MPDGAAAWWDGCYADRDEPGPCFLAEPDEDLVRTGSSRTPEEVDLRAMRQVPAGSALFGEHFLRAALFLRPVQA
ncbi:hypothetical protein [Streptomyces sp. NPDC048521]|uniref:hypothetical protein n=1 Tax=Streptomyces sp. NPDC048521 TaxID=3365566 RepID=UPI00371D3AEF